ncbi:hypothetical protein BTO15_08970 [Polaribacter sejongensis]|uniref:Transferase n=2 Tax=Polaribacter sejongensis TaxID=985043 RepID=A0ABN5F420_9FLAO|nr:hypothetical protein BTO15_08970 [Polaribacter sejongensis]
MFPFKIAKKMPVVFYGKVKLQCSKGKVKINAPIKFGMIGFGQKYELFKVSKKNAQLTLKGLIVFNGHVQIGLDYSIYINNDAVLEMGHLSSIGANGKIICMNSITTDDFARIGYESQLIDTSFHSMKDLKSNVTYEKIGSIKIGKYNYIGGRVSIMKSTHTPDYFTVSSNSLLTKNYCELGENVLVAGFPAKLIRNDVRRGWEEEDLEGLLII